MKHRYITDSFVLRFEMTKSDPTAIDIDFDPREQRMKGVATHGMTPFDVPYISHLADNLWQGGCADGLVLPSHINFMISLYPWERYTINHKMRGEMYIRMYDSLEQETDEVVELARLINVWRKRGEVLVHCQAGLNRSSLVAGMALILDGMKSAEAITTLRERRSPACLCNPSFEKYLKEFNK